MKQPSPAVKQLVSMLERERLAADEPASRAMMDLGILAELGRHAQAGLVPHLLPFLYAEKSVARAAGHLLAACIAASSPLELIELDERCRGAWSTHLPPVQGRWVWRSFRRVEVFRFDGLGDDEMATAGVASFHGNGWVREAAVRRLDATMTGAELPFLLIRLNDWVGPVAERAERAVRRRLTPQFADAFVRSLPILLRLAIGRRRDHAATLGGVKALLSEPASRLAVERGLKSSAAPTRRFLFRVALARADFDRGALVRVALEDPDPAIRLGVVKSESRSLPYETLASLLPRMTADTYPRIRREALSVAAERTGADANDALLAALVDRNQVVREVARFHLMRSGKLSDFRSFYRDRISQPAVRRGSMRALTSALAGLGETGSAEDVAVLLPFLDHAQPAVRRAGIRGIALLGIEDQLPRLVQMLRDPSPSVSDVARRVLRPHATSVGLEVLQAILRGGPHVHNRLDAVRLGAALGKWDRLPLMLEAMADTNANIRDAGRRWLHAWVAARNRSFVQPAAHQLKELRRVLDEYNAAVSPDIIRELHAILGSWAVSPASGTTRRE